MTYRPAPADQEVRDRALDPEKSFIVHAPAGSGKTELLVTRFVTLLAGVDYPEQILAITFTVKAAQEMRIRILESLFGERSDVSPALAKAATLATAQDKRNEWQLQLNPSRLRIMTVDSCNRHLVQRASMRSALYLADHMSVDNNIYRQAAWKMLSQLQEKADKETSLDRVFRHFGCDGNNLEHALTKMLLSREQWLDLFISLKKKDKGTAEDLLNEQLHAEATHVSNRVYGALSCWLDSIVSIAQSILCPLNEMHPYYEHIQRIAQGLPNDLDERMQFWQSIQCWLLTAKGTWRKALNRTVGFPPQCQAKRQMLAILTQISNTEHIVQQQLPPTRYTGEQVAIILDFATTFVEAAAWLELVCTEHNITDFSRVSQLALDSLGSDDQPAPVAELEYERIHHIFIDEFQDTSYRQYELLRRMVRDWSSSQDRHSLFIVGDPKQSIYRFRQAEPSLFAHIWEHGIGTLSLERLELNSNFRSNADMVAWCNTCFGALFPQNPEYAIGETSYVASTAEIQQETDQPVRLYLSSKEQDPQYNQINAALADEIRQLQSREDIKTIAILVARRKHAVAILPHLQQRAIAYSTTDLENIDQQQHVLDLLSLAKALSDPDDIISWLALLRHPALAVYMSDLLILCEQHDTIWQAVCALPQGLSPDGRSTIIQLQATLAPLLKQVYRSPWRHIIEDAWHLLGISKQLNNEQYKQCLAVLECIEQHTRGTQIDFAALTVSLAQTRHTATGTDYHRMTPHKPVSIMTIHKAKGLEFDAVLVPALGDNLVQTGDRPPFRWDRIVRDERDVLLLATTKARAESKQNQLYSYLNDLEKRKNIAEALRVLYVACTRSKVCLRLFARVSDTQSKENGNSYMQWLLHKVHAQATYVATKPDEERHDPLPVLMRSQSRLQHNTASATERMTEHHQPYNSEDRPQSTQRYRTLASMLPAIQGTEIHYLLEQLDQTERLDQLWQHQQSRNDCMKQRRNAWCETLRLRGVPHRYRSSIYQNTIQAIDNIINDPTGRWIFNRTEASTELSLQTKNNQDQIITRVIDRTFVDNGIRWIIDYKAVLPRDDENEQAFTDRIRQEYQQQLDQYASMFSKRETRPIHLGLYLVLQPLWIHWPWQPP